TADVFRWRMKGRPMVRAVQAWTSRVRAAGWTVAFLAASLLSACTSFSPGEMFGGTPGPTTAPADGGGNIGAGQVKVGLILPFTAGGNAGAAGVAMRNGAEMALAEFNVSDLQLLLKDDGGSAPGAQQVAQQALDEGSEIILGPIFAHSVSPVGRLARS